MMIVFYVLFALYIAYVWIDYFRMLDIFKKSSVGVIISQFILGALMILPIMAWVRWAPDFHLVQEGDDAWGVILHQVVEVGMVEEFLKFLPFVLSFVFIKKYLEEPIDYVMVICASALGFSAIENVMYFMDSPGVTLASRALFSTVSHLFNTSLLAYAVIRWKFKNDGVAIVWFLFCYLLASLSHGIFNSLLSIKDLKVMTALILMLFYFMFVVNWFASTINSAINHSPHFSYQKYFDGNELMKKLALRYGILIAAAVLVTMFTEGFDSGLGVLLYSTLGMALILSAVIFRITRLTLRKDYWFPIKLSFLIKITANQTRGTLFARYAILGSSIAENLLHRHFEKPSDITPISTRNSYLDYTRLSWMYDKIFIEDMAFFVVKIYHNEREGAFDTILIKDKQIGEAWYGSAPIVALFEFPAHRQNDWSNLKLDEIIFIEWAWMGDLVTDK